MKISVLVATKNRPEFIPWWAHSMVKQTRQPDEIIVVDTTGQDRSLEIESALGMLAYKANLKVFNEDPSWDTGQSRQKLLDECTGDVMMWWDDDDWHHPLYLHVVEQRFEESHINVLGFPTIYNLSCQEEKVYHTGSLIAGPVWPAGVVVATDLAKSVRIPERPKGRQETLGREVDWLTGVMNILSRGGRSLVTRDHSMTVPYIIFIHNKNVWGSTRKWQEEESHTVFWETLKDFMNEYILNNPLLVSEAPIILQHVKAIQND